MAYTDIDPLAVASTGYLSENGNLDPLYIAGNGYIVEIVEEIVEEIVTNLSGGGVAEEEKQYKKQITLTVKLQDGTRYKNTVEVKNVNLSVSNVDLNTIESTLNVTLSDAKLKTNTVTLTGIKLIKD